MTDSADVVVPAPYNEEEKERAYQLNLKNPDYHSANYKYRRLTQINGGTAVTLQAANTVESRFTLPGSSVWNFSRGFITLDALFGAPAAYTMAHCDSIPIERIQVLTDNGSVLVDLSGAQVYSKLVQPMTLSKEEYASRGPVYGAVSVGSALYPSINQNFGCQPVTALPLITGADGTFLTYRTNANTLAILPTEAGVLESGALSAVFPTGASGTDQLFSYPQQHIATSGNAAAMGIRYRINLKAYIGTLLAVDKSLFFGQSLTLVVNWSQSNNWAFLASDLAAAGNTAPAVPTISNLYLYMAEDINEYNKEIAREAFNNSYRILVPWTTGTVNTTSTAGLFSTQEIITPGRGYGLKRILSAVVSSPQTLRSTANTHNVAGTKWTTVQSFIDGKPLQDAQLVVSASDPWNYLYEFIKDSPVGSSQRTYQENMFWLDNFSDCARSIDIPFMDWRDSALNLYDASGQPIQKIYSIQYTTVPAASQVYMFPTYLQVMEVGPNGIRLAARM